MNTPTDGYEILCETHINKGGDDFWFPTPYVNTRFYVAEAKRICDNCPVKEWCLKEAVKIQPAAGIWAGYIFTEIRKMGDEKVISCRLPECRNTFTKNKRNTRQIYCSAECSNIAHKAKQRIWERMRSIEVVSSEKVC